MAQNREKGGRVVFIGNIPYGVSEEQICEIFGRVGTVVNFRLVYDKETGRPKGFGFLEYTDVDAAASAVRNLNGFEIMGRTLKVDYSNDNSGGQKNQNHNQQQDHSETGMSSAEAPPMPQGTDLPPGLTAPDAISRTLSQIPPPQLLDFISQMKSLVTADPGKATALLNSAPQLSYATFQALLLLGLVDTSIISSLVQTTVAQQQPPQQQQQQPPPAQYAPPQQAQPAYQQQQQSYAQPPPQFQQYGQAGYNPTPPIAQPPYQPPPQPQAAPAPPASASGAPAPTPENAALLQQLMSMTREQIYEQDEATRNTILQLRAQYGAPVS